jgi:hypothetical protein
VRYTRSSLTWSLAGDPQRSQVRGAHRLEWTRMIAAAIASTSASHGNGDARNLESFVARSFTRFGPRSGLG